MRSLLAPDEYTALIRGACFSDLQIIDRTPLAVDCFQKMADAFDRRKSDIVEVAGCARYEQWWQITSFYLELFRNRQLLYTQMLAR